MQMPVTQFEADSYEPTIIRFEDPMTLPSYSTPSCSTKRTRPTERDASLKTMPIEADKRRKRESIIGANCLSIIGLIEPGRTVRLYRQIH